MFVPMNWFFFLPASRTVCIENRCLEVLGCGFQLGQPWPYKIVDAALGSDCSHNYSESGCWLHLAFVLSIFIHTKSKMLFTDEKAKEASDKAEWDTFCDSLLKTYILANSPRTPEMWADLQSVERKNKTKKQCPRSFPQTLELTVLLSSPKHARVHWQSCTVQSSQLTKTCTCSLTVLYSTVVSAR